MKTKEVAKKLTELCLAEKNLEALETLYSPNIVSTEAMGDEQMPARMEGIGAVTEKNQWWFNANVLNSKEIQGPFFNGDNQFSLFCKMNVTNKENGKAMDMQEVCLYTVENGKIVDEKFFYDTDMEC